MTSSLDTKRQARHASRFACIALIGCSSANAATHSDARDQDRAAPQDVVVETASRDTAEPARAAQGASASMASPVRTTSPPMAAITDAGVNSPDSKPSVAPAATAEPVATPAELQHECGVAPDGLAPRFVTIDSTATAGLRLSMAVQGDPSLPPVVLVHGFPDFWCGWARVIPVLARRYFVVVPDLRGYNRSGKPGDPNDPEDLQDYTTNVLTQDLSDIVHYAAVQTQKKVAVVAHDWGAIIAWPFAARFGGDLDKLMAISVAHPKAMSQFLASTDPAVRTAQLAQAQALGYISELVMDDSPRKFSKDNYKKIFDSLDQKHLQDPSTFPEQERAAYRRMWDADDQASFKSQIKYYRANFGGRSVSAQTGELTTPVPTTFIAPIHDGALLYPHSMDYIRDHVAASQPLVLRPIDSGHFPQREKPAEIARMIEQFVDSRWD